ncbi:MAG: helix-turn-helix domain-containing protein [Thermodesulfovibrionales bacterium]|jgi:transcriptional regulator with XRE-family HTH domain
MQKISSGITSLDSLIESLFIGDNVVWEVAAGTSYDIFMQRFITRSFEDSQKVIYVSFNRSPQSVLNEIGAILDPRHFILVDCFTSGKGKSDAAFLRFYDNPPDINVVRISDPREMEAFTQTLNSLEDSLPRGARYVFDSRTGMQDLWGDEGHTYQFFAYMCPRLYDLGTVAYWILENDAHSQKFKANLRHITQVVFDLYERRDRLYIKAMKLAGRQNRDAFKPHFYEVTDQSVVITLPRKEPALDVGTGLREMRKGKGMSQKKLADRVGLTPSFISQMENNQISPSLSSFLQICKALGGDPGQFLEEKKPATEPWLVKRETVLAGPPFVEEGLRIYTIFSDEKTSARIIVFPRGYNAKGHFSRSKAPEFVHLLKGSLRVAVNGSEQKLKAGDSLYLKEHIPSLWRNDGGGDAEALVVCV